MIHKQKKSTWGFIAFAVKALTITGGGALVLTENHPYWTLAVLGIGAVANEAIDYFNLKK